jgi:hypothetical protein
MPSLTLSRAQDFRDTNQQLRLWLDRMTAAGAATGSAPPDCITALLSELLRAGTYLRAQPLPPPDTDPELEGELECYRRNIERLREILPSIYKQLLIERARLEAQRTRIVSATEWARASRQTL